MKTYKIIVALFFISVAGALSAQNTKDGAPVVLETKTGKIFGTELIPESKSPMPIVLIIAGSGPTDRNGNNTMMKNNSLKMLAEGLFQNGIATIRYDKRGIGESKDAMKAEKDIRFDDMANDATEWVKMLKADKRFSKIIVAGHSEGSLIGMIAANTVSVDGYISIAGAGHAADVILKEQLKNQPKEFKDLSYAYLDSLKKGKTIDSVPQNMYILFRPSVQPYMISWLKYDPQVEIKKLTIPVLILQGTTDIQVSVDDAKALSAANPKGKLLMIDNMNHVLKESEMDRQKNAATYSNPDLPLKPELLKGVTDFVKSIK